MPGNRLRDEKLPRGVSKVRRQNGIAYEARYTDPSGKQKQKTFRTKTEARQFIESTRTKVREGTFVDPRAGKIRVAEAAQRYLAAASVRHRDATRALYDSLYRQHLAPAFGTRYLSSLTTDDVQVWVTKLHQTHAAGTTHAAFNLLKRIVKHAKAPSTFLDDVTLPERSHGEARFLTPSQIATLADSVPPRYRALVLTGAIAGLRWGELVGLKTARLNLLARPATIQVAEQLTEVNGHFSIAPPKTRQSRRTVAIPTELAEELARHLALFSPNVHELVFAGPNGSPLRRSNFARRVWRPALKRAGLAHIPFHALRHTAAALMIATGAHPKTIQVRLGHATLRMTMDLYGHLFPNHDEDLVAGLGALMATRPASEAKVVALR
jgi:integrase